MPNRRKQADKYSSAVLQSGTADRFTTQETCVSALRLALALIQLREFGARQPLQVRRLDLRQTSRIRPAEGDGDMGRQETGKRVEGLLRQRLAGTAVRNVDMPRGREFRMESGGRRAI